jgi:thioredoxin 1
MKPGSFKWSIVLTIGLALTSLLMLGAGSIQTLVVLAASPVPTLNVAPLAVQTATPTEVKAGSSMSLSDRPTATEEEVAGPFAAMTEMAAMMNSMPTNTPMPSVSKIAFDGKPHFVDFNATWCAPCNLMRSSVRYMEAKYGEQITFDNVDTDNPSSLALSTKYQVEFIPLMVLLDKDGNIIDRLEGYQEVDELEESFRLLLEGKARKRTAIPTVTTVPTLRVQ